MPSLKASFSNIYLRVLLTKPHTTLKICFFSPSNVHEYTFFKLKAVLADISGVTLMCVRLLDWSANC